MFPFWFLYLTAAWGVLTPQRLSPRAQRHVWFAVGLLFSLVIGLRHEVGGDWGGYLRHLKAISHMSLWEVLSIGDPAYYVINWLVLQIGGGIYLVNFICGSIVMAGVITFARRQPMPWMALLVAVPYLIVVVAMGYTRQSVALGLSLIGLTALGQQRTLRFVIWVLLGALFHKSAVQLLPIAALAASRRRVWTAAWVAVTSALGALLLVEESSEMLWFNYVEQDLQSQGGAIRVAMNAVPSILFLALSRRFALQQAELRLWRWMAVCALACVPLVSYASTAVDRVALYFIPIQIFVFSRLPMIARSARARTDLVLVGMAYYALTLWVWLNYAAHAKYWVPYEFMPL